MNAARAMNTPRAMNAPCALSAAGKSSGRASRDAARRAARSEGTVRRTEQGLGSEDQAAANPAGQRLAEQRLAYERRRLVEKIRRRGVRDPRVLAAMEAVPRHLFVKDHLRGQAYADHALPIGEEQTISQPYVVARMTELLQVGPENSVLEIGTGSGYQTAILARLASRVYSLERIGALARQAIVRMRQLGVGNVKIQIFDGTVGWSDVGPFDRILVTAGAPGAPTPLLDQLKPGGVLIIPEGELQSQRLMIYRKGEHGIEREVGEGVVFVPLIGRHGWQQGGTDRR